MLGKYLSTMRSVINTERVRTHERFIIRKVDAKPKFYALDWADYKWVKDIEEATVFLSMAELERELLCTRMQYEAYYNIVRV